MFFRSETWGHVALSGAVTEEMNTREEGLETAMMHCRHGKQGFADPKKLLNTIMHSSHEIVRNPATREALDDFFRALPA